MKYVEFKIENKKDTRIYLQGNVNINTIDDTDGGDWEYEQNDGTYQSHLPNYWKVGGVNLSFEYEEFLGNINWEQFRQYLWDCQDENRSVDCGDYILHINEGAKMECKIKEHPEIDSYMVEIIPQFNGKKIDIISYMKEMNEEFDPWNVDDNKSYIEKGHIFFEMSKDYWDDDFKEELMKDVDEEARRIYARALTSYMGIYAKYEEVMEQLLDGDYDNEWLFKLSSHENDNAEEIGTFLREEGFIDEEV